MDACVCMGQAQLLKTFGNTRLCSPTLQALSDVADRNKELRGGKLANVAAIWKMWVPTTHNRNIHVLSFGLQNVV
jgi:hypothetical protein